MRPVLAMPRLIAWRIHHVAYVENLKPLRQSNFVDGVHQPEVAVLDEVEQRQPRCLILLGDRDDETQVGLDELALGLLAVPGGAAQFTSAGRRDRPCHRR